MSAITASASAQPLHTAAWWPTPKWWAATILAASGILATWGGTGWHSNNTLSGALITLLGQRLVAYLIPNGAPAKE